MSSEETHSQFVPKRSKRIRNLRARGANYNKDPNFLYDVDQGRPRASSTSSVNRRSKKKQDPKEGPHEVNVTQPSKSQIFLQTM